MAERLRQQVRRLIESRTLRKSLSIRLVINGQEKVGAELYLPQYWAVYYHDGRGPVYPVRGKYIVYFQNIEDDPRVSGGSNYPNRSSQIRRLRLAPEEFRALVESGKLVVRRSVGPARAHPFFERLGGRAAKAVAPIVRTDFSVHAKDVLADVLQIRGSIRIRL